MTKSTLPPSPSYTGPQHAKVCASLLTEAIIFRKRLGKMLLLQGESPDKKVRTFLKVEVAQASIFLAFKKINTGRKVAQTSIILTF